MIISITIKLNYLQFKLFLIFLFLINVNLAICQSKKTQINNLKIKNDSLQNVHAIQILFLKQKQDSIEQSLRFANEKIQNLKFNLINTKTKYDSLYLSILKERSIQNIKNNKLNTRLIQSQDSIVKITNELYYFKNLYDSLFSVMYGSKEELGKIIVFQKMEYRFLNPPGEWNGDYWIETIPSYFVKKGNILVQIGLEDCFNKNKSQLLNQINYIAKLQFQEDKKSALAQGITEMVGSLNLPFSFNDLKMLIRNEEICFEYDVGVWKGNNYYVPRYEVCFNKQLIMKYIIE